MDVRVYDQEKYFLDSGVVYDYNITKEINTLPSIKFTVLKKGNLWRSFATENYVETVDGRYVIKDVSSTAYEMEIYASYDAEVFKNRRFVGSSVSGDLKGFVEFCCPYGEGWTVNHHYPPGTVPARKSYNFDELENIPSRYDAIQIAMNLFDGEFIMDNLSKVIDVYENMHCGVNRGTYLLDDFNIEDAQIEESTSEIVTKLYAYGKDGLTVESITGLDYITNFSYTEKQIEGSWTDERYTDAQSLYNAAVKLLAEQCKPSIIFSFTLVDLYRITGNPTFEINVGDTVLLSLGGSWSTQVVVRKVEVEDAPDETEIDLSSVAGSLLDRIANIERRQVSGSSGGGGGSTSWSEITGKPSTFPPSSHNHDDRYYTESEIDTKLNDKQNTLVSGTNIKTINGNSLLGSGNINISGGGSSALACCSANNSSTGTVSTSATITKVTLNRFNVNTDSSAFEFSSGGIKCNKAGTIQINASIYIRVGSSSAATGTSGCYVYLNGTEIASNYSYTNNAYNTKGCTKIINVNAGDVITLMSRTSAAGLCYPGNVSTYLEVIQLA